MPRNRFIKPAQLFILPIFLLISACVFLTKGSVMDFADENSFLNRFPENQKAIVIVRINGSTGSKALWCDQKNLLHSDSDNCFWLYASRQYHIMMIKPGVYYLLKSFRKYPPLFSSVDEMNEQIKYLTTFVARAGEIVYIGDLSMKGFKDDDKSNLSIGAVNNDFIVQDNFDLLRDLLSGKNPKKAEKLFANQIWEKKYLTKQYPRLQNHLVKRLVKSFKLNDHSKKSQTHNTTTIDL